MKKYILRRAIFFNKKYNKLGPYDRNSISIRAFKYYYLYMQF